MGGFLLLTESMGFRYLAHFQLGARSSNGNVIRLVLTEAARIGKIFRELDRMLHGDCVFCMAY
jgi:hypothetical protein